MEVKKSPKADLEGNRITWVLMGLVVVLSAIFVAFEWKKYDVSDSFEAGTDESLPMEEEMIPITVQPEPLSEVNIQPKPQEILKMEEFIQIVNDDINIEDDEILTSELNSELVPIKKSGAIEEPDAQGDEIFVVVDKMPQFPGGMDAYMKWLSRHLRYPLAAVRTKKQGEVLVRFVVNANGTISDIAVVQGVSPALDQETLRVMRLMPRWEPGEQQGKPVRVLFTLPVIFRLS